MTVSTKNIGAHCLSLWLITRLIVSIDRRHSLEECFDIVDTVLKLNSPFIVGVDLCGDPSKGSFKEIKAALQKCRNSGLKGKSKDRQRRLIYIL